MQYLKIDAEAISETISKMVEDEIKKTVKAQVKKCTPKQYEIREWLEDIIHQEIASMLHDEVERFKADVLKPKVNDDIQGMIDSTDVLQEATLNVPHIVSEKMKGFEEAVFQRVMNSRFKDPEKPIAYEFHQLMAKYITRAYENSLPKA